MNKQLEIIGEKQYINLLDSMRNTVQEQITLHISYVRSTILSHDTRRNCFFH